MNQTDARVALGQLRALAAACDFADATELNQLLARAAAPIRDRILAERLETDAHIAFLSLHSFPPAGIPMETLTAELDQALSAIEVSWAAR